MALPLMALAGGQMLLTIMQSRQAADAQNELHEQNERYLENLKVMFTNGMLIH